MNIKKLLYAVLLIFTAFTAFVFLAVQKAMRPTTGPAIQKYEKPQKALLLIDIQRDYTGDTARAPFPYKNSRAMIDSANRAAEYAQKNGMPIAYIGQELEDNFLMAFLSGGRSLKGRPGTQLDPRLKKVNDIYFAKSISDAFSNEELEKFLIKNQVDEIYLAGLDAEKCVFNTAVGGVNRGYKVTVISDAVSCMNPNPSEVLENYSKNKIKNATCDEFVTGRK